MDLKPIRRLSPARVLGMLSIWVFGCAAPPDDAVGPGPAGDCSDAPVLASLDEMPTFAVVLSDFASTAIALLDENGDTISERWIDSGTQTPGLVTALSGDVTFPTRQRADGSMTLIDRFRSDVVTRFCLPEGQLAGQGRTHRVNASAGYSSNPYDVVWDQHGTAWATRFGANLFVDALPLDQGSDLYALDGESMAPLADRIDLSQFAATATLGAVPHTVFARPARMVQVGGFTVVGLARLSMDFRAAAPGMVARVNLETGDTAPINLEGMADCGVVVPVPGRTDAVVVACNGFPTSPQIPESRRASAGLVQLRIDDAGHASVEASWRPGADAAAPLAVYQPVSIGDGVVVASAWGERKLSVVNLRTQAVDTVAEASEPWMFGTPAWDVDAALLLVPDAEQGLRRFVARDGLFEEQAVNPIGMALRLPPRHAGRL